ncbi:MAG: penicillin-binding protein 1C, partial [Bacteroidota bacterium]
MKRLKTIFALLLKSLREGPRYRRRLARILAGFLGVFLLFLLSDWAFPLPTAKPYSPVVMAADSTLLCAYLSPDDKWRLETHLEAVNPDMIEAILHKEDRWFYYHPGVNPFAIVRAMWNNIIQGRRTSGASTITMQVARMSEPAARTYSSKLREVFRAFQLEWHLSKQEILERYLSYLPYGGNIEGVHAAARLYFDRPPSQLSLSQAILLAVIPNRPNSLRPDRATEAARAMRDRWIERYAANDIFAEHLLQAAKVEPIHAARQQLVPQTPHFCYAVRDQFPSETELYTTLDPVIQRRMETLLAQHTRRVRQRQVGNGAVLVLENKTGGIVAYAGSAGFNEDEYLGQIDGVQAVRSPGSTLKPLLYAMAMDQGRVTPQTPMVDVPTLYRGFAPENYDEAFRGQVSLRTALSYSLNIPPVRLLEEVGVEPFVDLLAEHGFETVRRQREGLGLSVVLGGCGSTLLELTRFYASFAHEGRYQQLRWTRDQHLSPDTAQVFTPESAWMIADILSGLERPDLPQQHLDGSSLPRIAWKTGTSYGRRDAWSIGFSPRYTVGVWMGNFDGSSVPELSGTATAVPLLVDLFRALHSGKTKIWFDEPHELGQRDICAESGLLPGPHCHQIVRDYHIPGRSTVARCNIHREMYISA